MWIVFSGLQNKVEENLVSEGAPPSLAPKDTEEDILEEADIKDLENKSEGRISESLNQL